MIYFEALLYSLNQQNLSIIEDGTVRVIKTDGVIRREGRRKTIKICTVNHVSLNGLCI